MCTLHECCLLCSTADRSPNFTMLVTATIENVGFGPGWGDSVFAGGAAAVDDTLALFQHLLLIYYADVSDVLPLTGFNATGL